MKSPICDRFGIDFPLLAFSCCQDLVAAVSKAGGLGASRQRRSPWTDAWAHGPSALPISLMSRVTEAAPRMVDKLAEGGHPGATELAPWRADVSKEATS